MQGCTASECVGLTRENNVQHPLDATELLIASWIVGDGGDRIPACHGILGRALRSAVERGDYPDWFRDQLHFVDSRIGLRCVELPVLLDWAQRAQLTTAPGPSYRSIQVQISDRAARIIPGEFGVSETDARKWGMHLRRAVDEVRITPSESSEAAIGEYWVQLMEMGLEVVVSQPEFSKKYGGTKWATARKAAEPPRIARCFQLKRPA